LIASLTELEGLLPAIRGQERVALDTEADSLHCYFEKLCLVQLAIPGHTTLIDPLADLSLQPLFDAFAGRELVLHGADYDLRLLRRAGLLHVDSLFDTMIAARLTGIRDFSLAALLKRFFGVDVPKASQKANWARRPLSEKMIEYARGDVNHLFELADLLAADLQRLGRVEWLRQSCAKLVEVTRVPRVRDEENAWRIQGSGTLRGRQTAVLRALWRWRDEEARAIDRPPFHIMQNSALIDAARNFHAGANASAHHLHGRRHDRFFEAARQAMEMPESQWPKPPPRRFVKQTPGQEERVETLKRSRDTKAAALDLDPSLLAPRAIIEAIAADADVAPSLLLPWQREVLDL
jgi:ribonuclease D